MLRIEATNYCYDEKVLNVKRKMIGKEFKQKKQIKMHGKKFKKKQQKTHCKSKVITWNEWCRYSKRNDMLDMLCKEYTW